MKITTFFFLLLFIYSCDFETSHENYIEIAEKYGESYNDFRKKVGLPLLKKEWERTDGLFSFAWKDQSNDSLPVHFSKVIEFNKATKKVISESDIYFGKKYFKGTGGMERESITIYYYYEKEPFIHDTGFYCEYFTEYPKGDQPQIYKGGAISLKEAEKILNEWGINRLLNDGIN